MQWQGRGQAPPRGWGARRRRTAGRRFHFWAGWLALIGGASVFHLVISPALRLPMGQGAGYQCRHNAYNCSDFRTTPEG